MKSQRGVRLPNAPATRKHGITKYDRKSEKSQNWRDYLEEMLIEDGQLEVEGDDEWPEEEGVQEEEVPETVETVDRGSVPD